MGVSRITAEKGGHGRDEMCGRFQTERRLRHGRCGGVSRRVGFPGTA